MTGADRAAVRRRLLAWYGRERRDLPWRRTSDPYAILVSEVMLQQTRVERVVPYYEAFLARFPTAAALARAPEDAVLAAWSGLGYYRRARSLRQAAIAIVERHGGAVPSSLDGLRSLPGIGAYTAGAVASIAFGVPAPAVDGNVARVLGRLRPDLAPVEVAAGLARCARPGDVTQALMELGARVCTPAPRCGACPVTSHCATRGAGPQRRSVVERTPPIRLAVAVVTRRGRVLLVPRMRGADLRGAWDLPATRLEPEQDLEAWLLAQWGVQARAVRRLPEVRHTILSQRFVLVPTELRATASTGPRWVRLPELDVVPVSSATLKVLLRDSAPPAVRSRSTGRTSRPAAALSPARARSARRSGRASPP